MQLIRVKEELRRRKEAKIMKRCSNRDLIRESKLKQVLKKTNQ